MFLIDTSVEIQCLMEDEIMSKYGYTFEDFEDDDGRMIFDGWDGYEDILPKYFCGEKLREFKMDLTKYKQIVTIMNK